MSGELAPAAARVQAALARQGLDCTVVELPGSTRTAEDAARAVGCRVEQIIKSLVFRGRRTGEPVLVLASGGNRVSEPLVAAIVGEEIERADPTYVRQRSGFAIGGVAPIGHPAPIRTIIDEDLLKHEVLWAAAGTPHAVFRMTATDLPRMSSGSIAAIAIR